MNLHTASLLVNFFFAVIVKTCVFLLLQLQEAILLPENPKRARIM